MLRLVLVVAALALTVVGSAFSQAAAGPPNLWLSLSPGDSLTSGAVITGAMLRRLPIDDPRHALVLVPGVRSGGGDIGIGDAPSFTIRGSALTQAGVYVDGAPVRFQTFGTQGIGLGAHAIGSIALISGVAPPAFGTAGGGVLAYTTRTGGDVVTGDVRWETDEPFGGGSSVGYNRIEGAAGGPLLGKVRWFLSATTYGQRSQYRGLGAASVPTFMPGGVDTVVQLSTGQSVTVPRVVQSSGEGLRRPLDWSTSGRIVGKLEYRYGDSSAISLTGLGSQLQQRLFPGRFAFNPAMYEGRRASGATGIANWRHALGTLRGSPLGFEANVSMAEESDFEGPLQPSSEARSRDPYLGMAYTHLEFLGLDVLSLPVTEQLVRNIRTNSGLRVPYLNQAALQPRQPHRLNPYGLLTGWPTEGVNGPIAAVGEQRIAIRGGVDWRLERQHVAVGLDFERTRISYYTSSLTTQSRMDVFREQPGRFGAYASDRVLVGGGGVLDIGVRYDRYAPGGEFPIVPGRIYSNPAWSPSAATDDAEYAISVARVFAPTRTQGFFSPRLRFGIPIGARATVRLGYGRAVDPPPWALFFRGANSDLDFTNTSELFGRDVRFGMVSLVDGGIRLAVTPRVAVDLGVFRKEFPQYVGRLRAFGDPLNPGDTIQLNVVSVIDAEQSGVDARIEWRLDEWFHGTAAYTFGSGDDVTRHTFAAAAAVQVPDRAAPGVLSALTRGLTATVLVRVVSGEPYTRLINQGQGTLTSEAAVGPAIEPPNSSRLPLTKQLDLRLVKPIRAGGREWEIFADTRNLLNFRNIRALFAETGGVTNDQFRAQHLAAEFAILLTEATSNNALEPDGSTINLSACGAWSDPVNCVALTRVERRFGDGDGLYSAAEQQRALNSYYDAFFGSWRFYGSGRTLRVGARLQL